ncbi:MAG: beta-ketoacyl synthase N-terminal-like domain-containing protein [Nitrospinota bacterium]
MPAALAVTGSGMVTAAGREVDATWNALCARRGFLVPDADPELEGFSPIATARCAPMDPESLGLDRRAARIAGHPTHLLLAAVSDALREAGIAPGAGAGLEDASLEDEDTAFFAALDSVDPGGGDLVSAVQAMRRAGGGEDFGGFFSEGMAQIPPLWPLAMLNPIGFCQVSIQLGLRGENGLFSPGPEAGAQAIIEAAEAVREGKARAAVAAGVGTAISARSVARYRKQKLLRKAEGPEAEWPRPFSGRGAAALGEGAGAAVLEPLEAARSAGKPIQGALTGWGRATALEGAGGLSGAIREAARRAMEAVEIGPGRVCLVVTHGAGTPAEDEAEAEALSAVLEGHRPRALATKGAFGHLLGASPIVDLLLALRALAEGEVPPSPGAGSAAREVMDFSQGPVAAGTGAALVLSQGFGGACAAFAAEAL